MVDVLTPEQRRLSMSRIRGRDAKPELLLRRGLHSRGLRFRLHRKDLTGCPDLVFPRFRAVIFVHGCFWHGHKCHLFKLPETRRAFWKKKIFGNADRRSERWRVLTVWECALRGRGHLEMNKILSRIESFLTGNRIVLEVKGTESTASGFTHD
jgi:DNA mismatch endonuclease (patch repair protein)